MRVGPAWKIIQSPISDCEAVIWWAKPVWRQALEPPQKNVFDYSIPTFFDVEPVTVNEAGARAVKLYNVLFFLQICDTLIMYS